MTVNINMEKKLELYDFIVGYGIGQNYARLRDVIKGKIILDYLADQKWENMNIQTFDGIPVIRLRQLEKLKNVLVILFPESYAIRQMIKHEIGEKGFDICNINDLVTVEHCVNGADLMKLFPIREYQDSFNNRIVFDSSLSSNVKIYFWGENNYLKIGSKVSINHLEIYFGNNGNCVIGDNTSIEKGEFHVSDALLDINKDCMFSKNIIIRTHDNHHIFDKDTGNRVNYAKDVIIKEQVWIGYGVSILPGAKIGTGSMVGEKAVTSSKFPDHVLIAGCPAHILRQNICWSRDNTFFFNRNSLNECVDKNSLKYIDTEAKEIYIAGAHSRAQTFAEYMRYLYPDTNIVAYLYDNNEVNPPKIGNVPVIFLSEDVALNTALPVFIGTRGVYHQEIEKHLREIGFEKIYPVTQDMDLRIRNKYLKKYFHSIGQEFLKIEDLGSLKESKNAVIYVVKSVFDKPLQGKYKLAAYEKEILAGAACVDDGLKDDAIRDDVGDNISDRNRQFCELTAMYWIWKHAKEEVVGLAHYRRHFILPDNWKECMDKGEVDVILPVPLYVVPNLAENYKSRHDPQDWNYMMRYLETRDEGLYKDAEEFFRGNLYSPCNMFIMRKAVLNSLCEWLFPILWAVANHGGEKADAYLNRYPGFLSERLITFFFERNRGHYKIVYADKKFLQ